MDASKDISLEVAKAIYFSFIQIDTYLYDGIRTLLLGIKETLVVVD